MLAVPTFISGFAFALFGGTSFFANLLTIPMLFVSFFARVLLWPVSVGMVFKGDLTWSQFFFYHWV